jgi:hypothetical protein
MTDTFGAPVCRLPNQGQLPALQSGRRFPAVPPANDLSSAIAAVNALAEVAALLLADSPPPNYDNNLDPFNATSLSPKSGGTSGITNSSETGPRAGKGEDGQDAKKVRFTEERRVVQHIKVVNPDDIDQYIFIARISSITFYDSVTDGRFTWEGVDLG